MSSLFLGRVIRGKHSFEVHAFTNGNSFRGYAPAAISDQAIFTELVQRRFDILRSGKPIFCTAVRPNFDRRIEVIPHDTRDGTVMAKIINQKKKGESHEKNQKVFNLISIYVGLGCCRDRFFSLQLFQQRTAK